MLLDFLPWNDVVQVRHWLRRPPPGILADLGLLQCNNHRPPSSHEREMLEIGWVVAIVWYGQPLEALGQRPGQHRRLSKRIRRIEVRRRQRTQSDAKLLFHVPLLSVSIAFVADRREVRKRVLRCSFKKWGHAFSVYIMSSSIAFAS